MQEKLNLLLVLEANCCKQMLGNIVLVHDETPLKGKYLIAVIRKLLNVRSVVKNLSELQSEGSYEESYD